jgi:hypothetical protein
MTEQALIRGLQTYPKRALITAEDRIPLDEADFIEHHQSLFPGDPIPELTRPWYNPDFARISYVRIQGAEEPPVISVR